MMTLFQARYVQYLTLIGCSIRATSGYFFGRYTLVSNHKTFRYINNNGVNEYKGYGGNQIDGILIRQEAIKVLEEKGIAPHFTCYGSDLEEEYEEFRKRTKIKSRQTDKPKP